MRGFGASKGRIFASFFVEQVILCLIGCLIGCAAFFVLHEGLLQVLSVLAFMVCYLAGAAISVLMIGRSKLMDLLAARE